MLTKEQQTDLIARYKAKQSYKQIFNETGIPGATAASFLRRKAPKFYDARGLYEKQLQKLLVNVWQQSWV